MSSQPIQIEDLGFTSWFELYEWCAEQGYENEAKITLTWPSDPPEGIEETISEPNGPLPEDKADVTLSLNTIRANAFKEVYPQLMTTKTKEVFYELLKLPEMSRKEADAIRVAIANLPTKTRP